MNPTFFGGVQHVTFGKEHKSETFVILFQFVHFTQAVAQTKKPSFLWLPTGFGLRVYIFEQLIISSDLFVFSRHA
jgi:hypothetical protein